MASIPHGMALVDLRMAYSKNWSGFFLLWSCVYSFHVAHGASWFFCTYLVKIFYGAACVLSSGT